MSRILPGATVPSMKTTFPRLVTASALALALSFAFLIPGRAQAVEHQRWSQTKRYVLGEVGPYLAAPWGSSCGVGKVCFRAPSDSSVWVRMRVVDDVRRRPVGGVVTVGSGWLDEGHTWAGRPFCGSSPAVFVPAGQRITVFLDAPGDLREVEFEPGPGCREVGVEAGTGTTAGATTGRVVASFTRAE